MVELIINHAYLGTDKPTLKLFNKYVRSIITPYWRDLGVQLLQDKNASKLKIIERNYVHDMEACCGEMFEFWLEVDEGASWNKLISALKDIKQNTIAVNISHNILKGILLAYADVAIYVVVRTYIRSMNFVGYMYICSFSCYRGG